MHWSWGKGGMGQIHPNHLWLFAKNTDPWVPSQNPESDRQVWSLSIYLFVLTSIPVHGVRGPQWVWLSLPLSEGQDLITNRVKNNSGRGTTHDDSYRSKKLGYVGIKRLQSMSSGLMKYIGITGKLARVLTHTKKLNSVLEVMASHQSFLSKAMLCLNKTALESKQEEAGQ